MVEGAGLAQKLPGAGYTGMKLQGAWQEWAEHVLCLLPLLWAGGDSFQCSLGERALPFSLYYREASLKGQLQQCFGNYQSHTLGQMQESCNDKALPGAVAAV